MENCVWTAQAWTDCMCGLPEGHLFSCFFIDFLTFFHNVAFYSLFIDFGPILGWFWLHFGSILAPFDLKKRSKKNEKKGVKKWNQGIPKESVSGGGGGLGVPKEQLKPITTRAGGAAAPRGAGDGEARNPGPPKALKSKKITKNNLENEQKYL